MNLAIYALAAVGALTLLAGLSVAILWIGSKAVARSVIRRRLREEAMKG